MSLKKGISKSFTEAPIQKGKLHFFGIGINDYQSWSKLKNAVNDVEAIAEVLQQQYFFEEENIVIFKNEEATRKNIVNKLHSYTEGGILSSDDSLIICFSGHGHLDNNGDGYWVPIESKENDIDSYIPNETIQKNIKRMKCLHVLLISDSCFSGSLVAKRGLPTIKSLVAEELSKKKSRFVFTSGGYKESVLDGFGEHSPFAEAILSELRYNTKPLLISDELALNVRNITHNNALIQMPEFMPFVEAGDMAGRFVFRLKGGFIPSSEKIPISEPLPAKTSWFDVFLKFGRVKISITLFFLIGSAIITYQVINFKKEKDELASAENRNDEDEQKKKKDELAIAEKKHNEEQEVKRIALEEENHQWENAKKYNSTKGFETYLKQYPNGQYKREAEKAIKTNKIPITDKNQRVGEKPQISESNNNNSKQEMIDKDFFGTWVSIESSTNNITQIKITEVVGKIKVKMEKRHGTSEEQSIPEANATIVSKIKLKFELPHAGLYLKPELELQNNGLLHVELWQSNMNSGKEVITTTPMDFRKSQ